MTTLPYYRECFRTLRVDRVRSRYTEATRFRAPHKPLLLLSVLDLAEAGLLTANMITLGHDLAEAFQAYWRVLFPHTRGPIILPFFHLDSGATSFWHLMPKPGMEREAAAVGQVRTAQQFDALFLGATLDDELFALLREPEARAVLRTTLLEQFFTPEAAQALLMRSDTTTRAWQYSEYLLHYTAAVAERPADYAERPAVRSQGFRRAVVHSYNYRCAQCGIRVRTREGYSAIEAAHIIPWSISRNDLPENGLALCKLCHWLFDNGLTAVTGTYTVLLSPEVEDNDNLPGHLTALHGRALLLPAREVYHPALPSLEWHRHTVYRHGRSGNRAARTGTAQ